jgi:hypothetical protein
MSRKVSATERRATIHRVDQLLSDRVVDGIGTPRSRIGAAQRLLRAGNQHVLNPTEVHEVFAHRLPGCMYPR